MIAVTRYMYIVEFLPRGLHNWIPPKYPLSSLSCLCSQKRSTGNNSWFLTFKIFSVFSRFNHIYTLIELETISKIYNNLTIYKIHTRQFKVRFLFSSFALYKVFLDVWNVHALVYSFFLNHHIFFGKGGGSFKVLRYDTFRIFWIAYQFKLIYSKYWTNYLSVKIDVPLNMQCLELNKELSDMLIFSFSESWTISYPS